MHEYIIKMQMLEDYGSLADMSNLDQDGHAPIGITKLNIVAARKSRKPSESQTLSEGTALPKVLDALGCDIFGL